jgi:hypothetical protein
MLEPHRKATLERANHAETVLVVHEVKRASAASSCFARRKIEFELELDISGRDDLPHSARIGRFGGGARRARSERHKDNQQSKERVFGIFRWRRRRSRTPFTTHTFSSFAGRTRLWPARAPDAGCIWRWRDEGSAARVATTF